MSKFLQWCFVLSLAAAAGCAEHPTEMRPKPPSDSLPPAIPGLSRGLIEVEITGIGTESPRATARIGSDQPAPLPQPAGPMRSALAPAAARSLALLPDTPSTAHDGTVEIRALSTSSFTWGTRGSGGYRYVAATFQVRNAATGGAAYGTPRQNLTFLAVSTASTLSGTALSALRRFDNSAASSALALEILPTGAAKVVLSSGERTAEAADVFQALTEAEVASITAPPGVTSILPYGFVVRNPASSSNRTLSAVPAADQFDGLVTFAYRVPLQATAADDPFTISAVFLAVDDDQVWVTQSLEETDAASGSAIAARATALGGQVRTLGTQLGPPPSVGGIEATTVCPPRTAGTAAAPTKFISMTGAPNSLSPSPYATGAGAIASASTFSATYCGPVTNVGPATFVVNGLLSGRAFLGGGYTGEGTYTLGTPAAALLPNEEVEVVLTSGITLAAGAGAPWVSRYRAATSAGSGTFSAATGSPFSIGGPSDPYAVAIVDFNDDGDPDMVTANRASNSVAILLGNGAGDFSLTSASPIAVGSGPAALAAGDLDGDTHPDLVVANSSANTLSVLLGDGAGGFSEATGSPITVGTNPRAVAIGDLDGDTDLDVVVSNQGLGTVSVLLGDGTGQFTAATGSPETVGTSPAAVALGDLNGDGDLDLVTGNVGNSTATVLLGDGTGDFTAAPASPISLGGPPVSIALGDLDHNGTLDLVTANSTSNKIAVLLGDGAGGFAAVAGSPFAVGTYAQSVAVGLVDADTDVDIVVANLNSYNFTVLLGDGTGGFAGASGSPFYIGYNLRSLALGYLDDDSNLDVALANTAGTVHVYLGNGSGGMSAAAGSPFPTGGTAAPGALAVGDIDGDGRLDLATANTGTDNVSLFLGDATNVLERVWSPLPVGASPSSPAFGDLDGDGDLDLVVGSADGLDVLLGDGAAGFTAASGSPFTVAAPSDLELGDVNADGRLDVVTVNQTAGTVGVLLGDGDGTFTAAPGSPFSAGSGARSLALGDIDSDGDLDVVTANWSAGTVSRLLGDGTGAFTSGGTLSAGSNVTVVTLGDLDDDGNLDLVVLNASNQCYIYLGDGLGSFSLASGSPFAPGTGAYSLALGDLDGDGALDLAIGHVIFAGSKVSVWLGGGDGTFTSASGSPYSYAAGIDPNSVTLVDLTGDGKLDLITANGGYAGHNVTVLVNQ